MATLYRRARDGKERRYSLQQYGQDYDAWMSYGGTGYGLYGGNSGRDDTESLETSFTSYIRGIYKRNGIVSATITARMLLFSDVRFAWQEIKDSQPGRLFGTAGLDLLENPWPNATTGEMLARAEQDVSLGGQFYAVRESDRLRRRRPDWMQIVLTAPPAEASASDVLGYLYHPGGIGAGGTPVPYLVGEIAHWSPIPDPDAEYRGMSWLTPVIEEIQSDGAATKHKKKFFENAATPNLAVILKDTLSKTQFDEWMDKFNASTRGSNNAYKTLFLTGGADAKALGANFKELEFKVTQGAGETRIAAAGRVPAVIVGLSEGLAAATYSNFGQARRMFGDGWARPQWRSICAALEPILDKPPAKYGKSRLWYNDKDVAFLREDKKEGADIARFEAVTIKSLVDAGYDPQSVINAMMAGDWTQLVHSGLYSVQLQPAGATNTGTPNSNPDANLTDGQAQ